jgi:hypothetical protein
MDTRRPRRSTRAPAPERTPTHLRDVRDRRRCSTVRARPFHGYERGPDRQDVRAPATGRARTDTRLHRRFRPRSKECCERPLMDQKERNRLRKLEQALLLAVSDMEQAIAAAQALTVETDGRRARVLETAIAVCYMRPFTRRRPVRLPDEYVPSAPLDAQGHAELKRFATRSTPTPTGGRPARIRGGRVKRRRRREHRILRGLASPSERSPPNADSALPAATRSIPC